MGMISAQILNTQLIDGLVQTLLALSLEERQLLFQRFEEEKRVMRSKQNFISMNSAMGVVVKLFMASF